MTTPEVPGFEQVPFTHEARSHQVYRAGSGPAVIVIPRLHRQRDPARLLPPPTRRQPCIADADV